MVHNNLRGDAPLDVEHDLQACDILKSEISRNRTVSVLSNCQSSGERYEKDSAIIFGLNS